MVNGLSDIEHKREYICICSLLWPGLVVTNIWHREYKEG